MIYTSIGRVRWLMGEPTIKVGGGKLVISKRFDFMLAVWGTEVFHASLSRIHLLTKASFGGVVNCEMLKEEGSAKWAKSEFPLSHLSISPDETSIVIVSPQCVTFFDTAIFAAETIDKAALWSFRHHHCDVQDLTWLGENCYVLWADGTVMAMEPCSKICRTVLTWPGAVCLRATSKMLLYLIDRDRQVTSYDVHTSAYQAECTLPPQNSELKHVEVFGERLMEKTEGMLVAHDKEGKMLVWKKSKPAGTLYSKDGHNYIYLEKGQHSADPVELVLDSQVILTLNAVGEIEFFELVPAWFLPHENQQTQMVALIYKLTQQIQMLKTMKW
jgi:hypothetical protein